MDIPFPQIREEIDEMVILVPRKHVQRQTDEPFVDIPVSQVLEEIIGVVRLVPRIVEHIVCVPVSQLAQRTVPVLQILACLGVLDDSPLGPALDNRTALIPVLGQGLETKSHQKS